MSSEAANIRDWETCACCVCGGHDHDPVRTVRGYQIVRCRACSLRFVNPRPTEAEITRLYSDNQVNPFADEGYEPLEFERPTLRKVVRRLKQVAPSGRLFEVGCGRGDLIRIAKEAGYEVAGCDLMAAGDVTDIPIFSASLADCGLADASQDIVIVRNTFEHYVDPRRELREVARVLKPGGVLYVKVPNTTYEDGLPCRVAFRSEHAYTPPWHLNHFSPKVLATFLASEGFDIVRWENEIPTRVRNRRKQAIRMGVYLASGIARFATGNRFHELITLACIAKRSELRS